MFVKDSDGSLLSATDYYTGEDVRVSVSGAGTFTRDSGSFLDDGLQAGFVISTSGFRDAVNNGQFIIDRVTDKEITVKGITLAPESGGDA